MHQLIKSRYEQFQFIHVSFHPLVMHVRCRCRWVFLHHFMVGSWHVIRWTMNGPHERIIHFIFLMITASVLWKWMNLCVRCSCNGLFVGTPNWIRMSLSSVRKLWLYLLPNSAEKRRSRIYRFLKNIKTIFKCWWLDDERTAISVTLPSSIHMMNGALIMMLLWNGKYLIIYAISFGSIRRCAL